MFSKEITESDWFVDMPLSSQALYFHLWMWADDDWFVSPQRVLRTINANKNDLDLLLWKWFCIIFEDWVVVITHWKRNNDLKKDRYKPTIYQESYKRLLLEDGCYAMSPKCIQNVSKMDTQYSIDKYSIVEITPSLICDEAKEIEQDKTQTWQNEKKLSFGSFWNIKLLPAELEKLKTQFSDRENKIENLSLAIESKWYKYKSHYATILAWSRKDAPKEPQTSDEYKKIFEEIWVHQFRKKYGDEKVDYIKTLYS